MLRVQEKNKGYKDWKWGRIIWVRVNRKGSGRASAVP